MKPGRQNAILEILAEREIETQQQLLEALRLRGIVCTQATLSRDMRELRLEKTPGLQGRRRYAPVPEIRQNALENRLKSKIRKGLRSCELAQNLLVLKTRPGHAGETCLALESLKIEGLVGTIAGGDTAFVAMRDVPAAQKLYETVKMLIASEAKRC